LDGVKRNALKIEPLAARGNCSGNLVQLGCGKNEYGVRRRLFKRFQECIECRNGKHVNLINNIDPVPAFLGAVTNIVAKSSNIVYAVVGGSVKLRNVHARTGIKVAAAFALPAGFSNITKPVRVLNHPLAVQRLGKHPCRSGFTHPAQPRKNIAMPHPLHAQ